MEDKRKENIEKQLKRIAISFRDIDFALKIANYMLENQLDSFQKQVYERALIVAYICPFSGNDIKSTNKIGDLNKKYISNFSDNEEKVHNRLEKYRNTIVAHSDSIASNVKLEIWNLGDKKLICPTQRIFPDLLSQKDLLIIQNCCEKIKNALLKKQGSFQNEIF